MKIEVDLENQVKALVVQLESFKKTIQTNVHIGALRVATNAVKDGINSETMTVIGKSTGELYSRKNLRKPHIAVKKRRRTRAGWERFKITVMGTEPKPYRYNIITASKEQPRYTKAGKYRGILKRDPFIQRGFDKSYKKGLQAYIAYMKARINVSGAKISAKDIRNTLRSI